MEIAINALYTLNICFYGFSNYIIFQRGGNCWNYTIYNIHGYVCDS